MADEQQLEHRLVMSVPEVIFWMSLGLIVYTLILYPMLALVLSKIIGKSVNKQPVTPPLSLIISAYNEEKIIAKKMKQTLDLDYPRHLLEIIVASDGSTDRTDEIVRSFADQGVRLLRVEGRRGKTAALNEAVRSSVNGEIIVFSDATGVYNSEALRELAANFNDPSVGCVTGRVQYRYKQDTTSVGFKGYQRFAVAVRRAEGLIGSQTSVSGSIHAIRRSLYKATDPAFSLDVINALHAVVQNHRVVYESRAISWEEARSTLRDEFRCRVRIGVRNTTMISYIVAVLLKARKPRYLFQMVSHKILRWWLWCFLIVLLGVNSLLVREGAIYAALFSCQMAFYGAALLGAIGGRYTVLLPGIAAAAFFSVSNAAMAVGAVKSLLGRRMPSWEPVR